NAYGPGVIGVVLTGSLDCGTAGLMSIKARGGIAVVQDPRDAQIPEMPQSAVAHLQVDHVVPLREIAPLLGELVRRPVADRTVHVPSELREIEGDEPGVPADLVCPLCQGRLTESEMNGYQSFRCHVGHAFSLEAMAVEQAEETERALWAAVRALEESATLARRLASSAPSDMRRRFEEKQEAQTQNADLIRRILLSGGVLSEADAPGIGSGMGKKEES